MDGARKPSWRALSKQCSFGVRIQWFRVDGRSIRVVSLCRHATLLPTNGVCVEERLHDYSKDGCVVD